MSRIKNTLDSVSKAISGTVNTEVFSKITRLRPSATSMGQKIQVKMESPEPESAVVVTVSAPVHLKPKEEVKGKGISRDALKLPVSPAMPPGAVSTTVSKQTLQRFQPTAFTVDMDETYNHLAEHVNTYFGSSSQEENRPQGRGGDTIALPSATLYIGTKQCVPVPQPVAQKVDPDPPTPPALDQTGVGSSHPTTECTVPAIPSPQKKGISNYLSYKRPKMQAFMGNYIAPLIPKFRADSANKDKAHEVGKAQNTEQVETKAQGKEKVQSVLSQKEKIKARVSVDNKTRALAQGIRKVINMKITISRVEELSYHLLEFPETRGVAVTEKVIPYLLRLRQSQDPNLQAAVRLALALVGYTDPVKGRGIRVLSIDGGGTRGLVALQTLHRLESLTGKPVYQLFDYICGVSTGAILAFMLGVFRIPLPECEELYRKLGSDVFKQNLIVGTVKMGWSHAFYDSQIWEDILKERMGDSIMIETTKDPDCPKVAAVSTIVNRGLPLKAYIFRNYNFLPGVRFHYLGGCQHMMWQAIRASSAAPGYFQEYVLGNDLHQDGGLLINNPTALAIHECKCLWPNTPLQCVVSLGTGRYEATSKSASGTSTSLKTKLTHVISSATDTEEVHTMLDALLPPDTYFRFNPYMSEDIPLDENRREKLNFLQAEGQRYLERNEAKMKKAASVLSQNKSAIQRLAEWLQLKADMYDGLPFHSKL
ncbi:calcium-independent phospholipase A2-gamma [Electrophorus electricus]|uniref:PNPLA domain-containing protein n=1 Tax=Electrophorus electricus TaxID=8005 RepID=A0A4W4HIZ1_ELEEL|nr:calcium-independent phospholipase A2-gamma [Electrophorus electricus]XP_035379458.1 calcium-independent phospholipase A2-gamma [Electrophorus electricus]